LVLKLISNTLLNRLKIDLPLAGLFIFAACYLILSYESKLDRLFYFSLQFPLFDIFKTKFGSEYVLVWFSNLNRIIVPLLFWVIAPFFIVVGKLIHNRSFKEINISNALKGVFIFHLFLLLTKNTFTPYYWEFHLPGVYRPGLVIENYHQIAAHIGIVLYFGTSYLFIINYWKK
jgi:hypothetical protein